MCYEVNHCNYIKNHSQRDAKTPRKTTEKKVSWV